MIARSWTQRALRGLLMPMVRRSIDGVIFASIPLLYSHGQTRAEAKGYKQVSLAISLPQETVKQGSIVVVRITMSNISQDVFCMRIVRGMESGALTGFETDVRDANSLKLPIAVEKARSYIPKGGWSAKKECLQPGQAFIQELRLNELYDLDTPGNYKVRITLGKNNPETMASSNEVGFEVEPQ